MIKSNRRNIAVSEVLGTILLLAISVTLFSTVYVTIFSVQVKPSSPTVNIIGTIEDNNLILEHRGGESLPLDTGIILGFAGGSSQLLSVNDGDYLDAVSKSDGKWGIGERFVYPLSSRSADFVRFNPIDLTVIDTESNSVVMSGTVQEARVADIGIEMTVSKNHPTINEDVTFHITAGNDRGPSDAAGILIKDILPGSLNYISSNPSKGAYDPVTGVWNLGDLVVGNFATLDITAKVVSHRGTFQVTLNWLWS